MSQKAPDSQIVPLCRHHHRLDKYALDKGRRNFETHYGIDLRAVIARLTQKPKLSIRSGYYIGVLDSQEYMAGPITIGPREAARRTLEFFRECYIESARRRKTSEIRTRAS